MAAALSGDVTGRVPLNVKLGAQMINKVRKRLVIGKRKIKKLPSWWREVRIGAVHNFSITPSSI